MKYTFQSTEKMSTSIKNLSKSTPRNNLPYSTSRKRTESNFTKLFINLLSVHPEMKLKQYLLSRELDLNGYGIADLILFEYKIETAPPKDRLIRPIIVGFEIKIKDWRKAIQQAFRYKYYANKSIVVLPQENSKSAIQNLSVFKMLGIGLWSINKDKRQLVKYYTPRIQKPLNEKAREKAISIIKSHFKVLQAF